MTHKAKEYLNQVRRRAFGDPLNVPGPHDITSSGPNLMKPYL